MYSKQSNLSDFSAQMYFPLYCTYIFSVSEHQPTSNTIFGCLSLVRWEASFSKCLSLTPGDDELSFFTAIVFPFGSTPCLNCLINNGMSFFIVWWHMLEKTERCDLILPYIPCQNHLHQVSAPRRSCLWCFSNILVVDCVVLNFHLVTCSPAYHIC